MFSNALIVASVATVLTGSVEATTGRATWYQPSGAFSACGVQNQNSDFVVALSPSDYAGGSHCLHRAGVNFQGKHIDVTVVDLCPGCEPGHIDLAQGAFQSLASLDLGVINVNWNFE